MPEVFADDRDICAFLFLGQKSTAANWANPKDIEIVRRYPESRELDGITEAGQGHGDTTIGGKTVKDRLAVPVLKEARRRTGKIFKAAALVGGKEMDHSPRVFKR